jgi:hypothetical protein
MLRTWWIKSKSLDSGESEIELHSDAWERFKRAVHVMAKAGPQHRISDAAVKSGPKERPASKGRVHKGKSRV